MANKPAKLLRDGSGRVFLNCKQLQSRKGYEPIPDPKDFETVGTVAGMQADDLEVEEAAPRKKTKKKVAKKAPAKEEAASELDDWD